jgi:cytochrome c oxidase subunit 2
VFGFHGLFSIMFFIIANYLPDPVTYSMESIVFFFRDTMTFVYVIGFFVFWILYRCIVIFHNKYNLIVLRNNNKYHKGLFFFRKISFYAKGIKHFSSLEVIWTLFPAIILIILGIPSFSLLYFLEEFSEPHVVLKVEGHQWYWHYQVKGSPPYYSFDNINFDSYMIPCESLKLGQLRLLEVDMKVYLPVHTHIQIVATSVDVIHSWSVPSLGVKIDCCPGRLNESMLYMRRQGVFYGQCSEICGMNHAFMPIVIRCIKPSDFACYVSNSW